MVKGLFKYLIVALFIVWGIVFLYYLYSSKGHSTFDECEYQQTIDSLVAERVWLLERQESLRMEVDSLSAVLRQVKVGEQKVKVKYVQIRSSFIDNTTDEHIQFLTEQLSK